MELSLVQSIKKIRHQTRTQYSNHFWSSSSVSPMFMLVAPSGSIPGGEQRPWHLNGGTTNPFQSQSISSAQEYGMWFTNSPERICSNSTYFQLPKTQYYLTVTTEPSAIPPSQAAGWYDSHNSKYGNSARHVGSYTFSTWKVDRQSVSGIQFQYWWMSTYSHSSIHNGRYNPPTIIGNSPTGSNVPVNTQNIGHL